MSVMQSQLRTPRRTVTTQRRLKFDGRRLERAAYLRLHRSCPNGLLFTGRAVMEAGTCQTSSAPCESLCAHSAPISAPAV